MSEVRRSIAIVDDEDAVRVALSRLCGAYGWHAQVFATAHHLCDSLLDGHRPDCLILDVQMPGFGGLDVQAWLRDRGIRIPVILITGREDDGLRAHAFALGAHAYLGKPMDAGVLLGAIRNAIEGTAPLETHATTA
jgi:FixJ family two-component response regulator